jgi:uncharacterized protein (TIGR02246 family)
MPADPPTRIHDQFEKAFNAADLAALVALYEPGAVLVTQPNGPVTGLDAIREAYRGFLVMKPKIHVETLGVFESAGGIAMMHGRWEMTGTQPDGSQVRVEGRNTEVVRRQPDGRCCSRWITRSRLRPALTGQEACPT